jgi:hypothetical protein
MDFSGPHGTAAAKSIASQRHFKANADEQGIALDAAPGGRRIEGPE